MKFVVNILKLFSAAVLLGSSISFAQDTGALRPAAGATPTAATATGAKKERKASINFEDELVQGSAQKPELFYLFQRKNFNYKRLIKLRENFIPEMRNTTEDIQRIRSKN